jgi:thiamine monophosphate synthase
MKKVADTDISIPIIAIGGITFNDIPFLLETGIYGVAVSASIAFSQNFEKSIHQFVQYFENIHVKQP